MCKMTISKRFSTLCVALAAIALFSACKKDDNSLSIAFSSSTPSDIYFDYGQTIEIPLTIKGSGTESITEIPEGWSASFTSAPALSITAPTSGNGAESGSLKIQTTDGERTVSATLTVTISPAIQLDANGTANCYIASKPNTRYRFKATVKGNSNEAIVPVSAAIVWQSGKSLIGSIILEGEDIAFFTTADADDETQIAEGNGVIAARDADGNILWSWHIWCTPYDPETENIEYTDGQVAMTRNLGAMSDGSDDLYRAFGLFYQWGRKDPLIMGASATSTSNASSYTGNSNANIAFTTAETSSENGTIEYSIANPMKIITGTEESDFDWLYSAHDNSLWSENKTKYDPCPPGWRVPTDDLWSGIADSKSGEFESGWTFAMADGTTFYPAAGRRSFSKGSLTNVNADGSLWTGYYWSCTPASENRSNSLYFNIDTIDPALAGYRAGGYQIRCVKE